MPNLRTRRSRVLGALSLIASLQQSVETVAQTFPSRPITLIVPFATGAANDLVARTIADQMKEGLGTIVIDNKPGGSATVGVEIAKRAPADGHTMVLVSNQNTILAAMRDVSPFDLTRDFEPIVMTNRLPFFLVVSREAVAAASVRELIDYAKANPGKLSYATPGNGSPHHLAMELFKLQTGTDIVHVPYKGMGQGALDLVAGRVQLTITGYPAIAPHMQGGKLRMLGTAGAKRTSLQPDVPTIAESGLPGFDVDAWQGLLVPAGTPKAVIVRLNAEANRALQTAALRERFAQQGVEVAGGSTEHLGTTIRADLEQWRRVVKAAGIKPD